MDKKHIKKNRDYIQAVITQLIHSTDPYCVTADMLTYPPDTPVLFIAFTLHDKNNRIIGRADIDTIASLIEDSTICPDMVSYNFNVSLGVLQTPDVETHTVSAKAMSGNGVTFRQQKHEGTEYHNPDDPSLYAWYFHDDKGETVNLYEMHYVLYRVLQESILLNRFIEAIVTQVIMPFCEYDGKETRALCDRIDIIRNNLAERKTKTH